MGARYDPSKSPEHLSVDFPEPFAGDTLRVSAQLYAACAIDSPATTWFFRRGTGKPAIQPKRGNRERRSGAEARTRQVEEDPIAQVPRVTLIQLGRKEV